MNPACWNPAGGAHREPGLAQNLTDGCAVGAEVKLAKSSRKWRQQVNRTSGEEKNFPNPRIGITFKIIYL